MIPLAQAFIFQIAAMAAITAGLAVLSVRASAPT
jgi:hypothetical protein